ncbi:MAG: hypothetical protein Q9182_003085 [Xanthomendoza sp. 2 TL-2023]
MRLTCCQSIFTVSSIFLTYICYFSTYQLLLAQTSDADTIIHEDHNHHRLHSLLAGPDEPPSRHIGEVSYEPHFLGLDRGIVGRAADQSTNLNNNAPQLKNIEPGDIQSWVFSKAIVRDPGRQPTFDLPLDLTTTNTTCLEEDLNQIATDQRTTTPRTRTVWLTISTCSQPTSTTAGSTRAPSQLEVYVSLAPRKEKPDSGRSDQVITVKDGYGNITVSSVNDDIWIGVRAPPKLNGYDGMYSYELVASVDAPYATYIDGNTKSNGTELTAWDSDSKSAILWTGDTTNALSNSTEFSDWMELKPEPFKIYVHDQADPALLGISRSVCGLKTYAMIKESNNSMIKIGGQPKQQFYVQGLNRSSSYNAIMTFEPKSKNSTVGGGGTVWKAISFTTKSDTTCQIIYNLPFCTDVAYAVPSNPTFANRTTDLALTYDNWARTFYANFDKSLQQIPCETTPSARYSLARNCTDCENAYKTWLCAVTIPRCEDAVSPPARGETHLRLREPNSSRNAKIDETIRPGRYREMLPCKELCYHLVQSCPAALQFACPLEERLLNESYGHHRKGDKEWKCNWPGGPNLVNAAAGGLRKGWGIIVVGVVFGVAVFVL